MIERTFISGATGGIGKAFVYECAKKGYHLFLTGRSKEKLEDLRKEVQKTYPIEIDFFACDLTVEEQRSDMLLYAKGKGYLFNRIINVAGVDIQKPFCEYTREKLLFQLRVNFESTVDLTYSFLKLRAKEVEIITIASMSGATPMPYFALYSATKSALVSLFTSLREEYKREKVKITTVLPGGVPTREDIILDIEKQGLWGNLSKKSPQFIARKSLKAVKRNKRKYIPGVFNKFLYFTLKIIPESLAIKFIARRWKKIRKDAF